jgi:Glycoside-hydrolase family GH114
MGARHRRRDLIRDDRARVIGTIFALRMTGMLLVTALAALLPGTSGAQTAAYQRPPSGRAQWYWEIDPPAPGLAGLPSTTGRYPAPGSANIWDTDLFQDSNTPGAGIPTGGSPVVRALHASGKYSICYIEAGAYQTGFPDASDFAAANVARVDGMIIEECNAYRDPLRGSRGRCDPVSARRQAPAERRVHRRWRDSGQVLPGRRRGRDHGRAVQRRPERQDVHTLRPEGPHGRVTSIGRSSGADVRIATKPTAIRGECYLAACMGLFGNTRATGPFNLGLGCGARGRGRRRQEAAQLDIAQPDRYIMSE